MDGNLEEAPLLIGQTGPLKGQRWTLTKSLLIGRESTCDVSIPDRQVSRFHAKLTPSAKGILLEDLGSKNGTHCNGARITGPVFLKDGDLVQVALAQQFVYLTSDATMPLEGSDSTGLLRLDVRSRRVWVNEQLIEPPLSALQFHVLRVLSEHTGQVVDRQTLVAEAWGDDESVGVSDQALDALIRRLRDRIAEIDPSHTYIATVRGHGIRLDNPEAE